MFNMFGANLSDYLDELLQDKEGMMMEIIHQKEQQFIESLCQSQRFVQNLELKLIQNMNPSCQDASREQEQKCYWCEKKFTKYVNFCKHVHEHHSELNTCPYCKSEVSSMTVGQHMTKCSKLFQLKEKNSLLVPQPSNCNQDGPSKYFISSHSTSLNNSQPFDEAEDGPSSNQHLNILQWNCYHLTDLKFNELETLLEETKPSILCLSEISAVDKKFHQRRFADYSRPLVVKPDGAKGVAMYIRLDVKFKNYASINDDDKNFYGQSIDIAIEDDMIRLFHLYVNPNTKKNDRIKYWDDLTSNMEEVKNFVIVGDINENSKLFGECNSSHLSSLDQMIEQLNLNILNDGSPTRMCLKQDKCEISALDVTITSKSMVQIESQWNVLRHIGSDHFPIQTQLNVSPVRKYVRPPETTRD